eukprot:TRINITY_DN17676_c0_g1_i1.p1 TRINITY_DN17676_c0_g1~~TRINITY_DN17676_c0_g1_i1.p1  ORF type:complete len:524 (-),score=69.34 TRINITY_DN17676_c0_g1_i1:110-1681(-)
MDPSDPWDILWFSAFETTAVITATLVGLFAFIPNPTGRQDAQDASEISVFYSWRRAIVLIGLDLLLKVVVLAVQWAQDRPAYTIFWTLALMTVPWAPFLDKVVAAVLAWGSVRTLMRNRVARNEVLCVLSEYLRMGNPRMSAVAMAERVTGKPFLVPEQALQALLQRSVCRITPHKAYRERVEKLMDDVRTDGASWVMTRRTMRHGLPMKSRSSHQRRLMWRRIDVWMRCWTGATVTVLADPFPPGILSRKDSAVDTLAASHAPDPASSATIEAQRTYILDKLDDYRGGHTMSQLRARVSLPQPLCHCCELAVCGAVEAFLESSSRAHVNVCARAWLANTHIDWSGRMEGVVDAMWEAAFVDQAALGVEDGEVDNEGQEGAVVSQVSAHPTSASRRLLVIFFLVARSVLGTCTVLEDVAKHIQARLHSLASWTEYWEKVVGHMAQTHEADHTYDGWIDGIKARALREVTVAEMRTLVELLAKRPLVNVEAADVEGKKVVFGSFCNFDRCLLSQHTSMVVTQHL